MTLSRSEEENGHGFVAVPKHNRRVCFRQELTESIKRVISVFVAWKYLPVIELISSNLIGCDQYFDGLVKSRRCCHCERSEAISLAVTA